MSIPEATWEMTTRVLWAFVGSAILLGVAVTAALTGTAGLYFLRGSLERNTVWPFFGVAGAVFCAAAGLFGYAARYPSENDHDVEQFSSKSLFAIRLVLSLVGVAIFLWIARFALGLALKWTGGLEKGDFSALKAAWWTAWAVALVGAASGFTRAASIATAMAAGVLILFSPCFRSACFPAVWAVLILTAALAFQARRKSRSAASVVAWAGMGVSVILLVV